MKKLDFTEENFAQDGKPKKLVIFLHGYGSNGDDLITLAHHFKQAVPDSCFISPNAPFPCAGAPFGFQWFDLSVFQDEFLLKGLNSAVPILENFIKEQLARFSLQMKDLILIGFSQGTMMALHSAIRLDEKIAGVVGFSGGCVTSDLTHELKSKPKILLIHGTDDEVVPSQRSINSVAELEKYGVDAQVELLDNLGHSIDLRSLNFATKFLQRICKK
jgi:phospholipase/carboxylesterase